MFNIPDIIRDHAQQKKYEMKTGEHKNWIKEISKKKVKNS